MNIPAKQRATDLFLTHYGFVMRIAFRHAPITDLVDDVIQETFHRFVNHAEQYDLLADIRPLLQTIAKNVANDYWEQRQRERTKISRLILEHVRRFGMEQAAMEEEEKESSRDYHREQSALDRCLDRLPERARSVIRSYYYKQQHLDEIAKTLESSPEGIKQLLFRLRKKLRACINKQLGFARND